MNTALLGLFIPTFFFVSITPGMNMTLALTLGMSVGYRRTLWMMVGELLGVALVAVSAVVGIAAVMLRYPDIFTLFKSWGKLFGVFRCANVAFTGQAGDQYRARKHVPRQ